MRSDPLPVGDGILQPQGDARRDSRPVQLWMAIVVARIDPTRDRSRISPSRAAVGRKGTGEERLTAPLRRIERLPFDGPND